jgi:hypothetical protein
MDSVLERVLAQYPSLAPLLGHPEIGPLLVQAVDPNVGFSQQTFESRLHETTWWRTTAEPARQLELQMATDPASAQASIDAYRADIRRRATSLGVALDENQVTWVTAFGMRSGYAPDSTAMQDYLSSLIDYGNVLKGIGAAGAAKDQVLGLVEGQWLRTIQDPNWLAKAGVDVATGKESLESINAQLASQAWQMYPHLRQMIDEGQTMADIFNPYRQIIASELEYGSLDQVDMNNPEWSKLIQWVDPSTREVRLPTASEVMTFARDRDQWWQTSKGRQTDAGMARTLLEAFGKVAA